MFYILIKHGRVFDQSERVQGPLYISENKLELCIYSQSRRKNMFFNTIP